MRLPRSLTHLADRKETTTTNEQRQGTAPTHAAKKQQQLFNTKNVNKWENPDAARLPKADQDELLRDPNNVKMIAVAEQ